MREGKTGTWKCCHGSQCSVFTQDPTVPSSFQDLVKSKIRPMDLDLEITFFSLPSPPLPCSPPSSLSLLLPSMLKMENKTKNGKHGM